MSNPVAKVIVGMSGGVDSSVAAYVLMQQGYAVEGLFMKNWEEDDGTEYCTALTDLADAQQVADALGIKLHTANFAAEYWDRVFEHFIAEYSAGRTPNPDILCNKEVKFRAFLDYALTLGADFIATGHYARRGPAVEFAGETVAPLLKGLDQNKDQSYFLHAVNGRQIARTLFPLGDMEKPAVRAIAKAQGFANHDKKDSTGICFIGERRFKDFLEQYIPAKPGVIITESGEAIGEHSGLMFYTIGQRQGLGIGGLANCSEAPWFVLRKDLERNQLVVGQGTHHPALFTDTLSAEEIFWVTSSPALPLRCKAKTRYRQPDQDCLVSTDASGRIIVQFDQPQRAVTPGQSVVFYDGETCLGGGVIDRTWNQDGE
ncbi:tRNA 2-thiouridine(34) synthase MnmA [Ketobacter sp.]|uniref:tRNA 2-thiouridine(34) synthase MnmA n=1 Tax=Ketobacter sp. TaxID=2083498 RepID=UPI000F0EFF86|nr:tRNA 2-thiouridine(34) synthase MnmA [Ketobacter sp.]RLT97362.1 MAG: tRNA 2-thiouridine(34) synthase MnmA [Ketobacter sp.]